LRDETVEVEPHVIKIAETRIDEDAVRELLKYYNAAGWLRKTKRHKRSDSEFLTELAGRVCYRSYGLGPNPNITKIGDDPGYYLQNVLRSRHGSVLEHATVTFAFLNVSRVFTHELVRHRAGTAISQESLRYRKLEGHFRWDEMNFEKKKRVTSALRRILPEGLATNVIWTANHRTIRWTIETRTDSSAEIEIREVFGSVAQICIRDYPLLYGDFRKKALEDGTFQYTPKFSKV